MEKNKPKNNQEVNPLVDKEIQGEEIQLLTEDSLRRIGISLPKGWIWKELGQIAEITMGQSPPSNTYNNKKEGIPFFQGKAEFGKKYPQVVKYCSAPKKIAKKSDILMSIRAPVGAINIADADCCIGRGLCSIRPKKVELLYLYYMLQSKEKEIKQIGQGSTFKAINQREITRIMIPIAPLSIQIQIVSILRRAEKLKEVRQVANEDTSKIIQIVFYDTFGKDKFPLEPIRKFVKKIETRNPLFNPETQFKYIDIASIDNKAGRIVESKIIKGKEAPSRARKVIKSGDVIVSTVRPNLNATALVPADLDDQICSTGFSVLRTNGLMNNKYLYVFTRTNSFVSQLVSKTKGASYPAVSDTDVLNILIPAVPIHLQHQFAEIVKKIELLKQNQQQSTEEINTLFDALVQKAFKGELVAA